MDLREFVHFVFSCFFVFFVAIHFLLHSFLFTLSFLPVPEFQGQNRLAVFTVPLCVFIHYCNSLFRKVAPSNGFCFGIIIGGVQSILDMRRSIYSYGAPELSLLSAAMTEMCHHCGLSMYSTAGCTDTKKLELQDTNADGSFDVVYSMGTVEHFDETEAATRGDGYEGENVTANVRTIGEELTGRLDDLEREGRLLERQRL